MLGQFPTVKDLWPDKFPWSEDVKWISLSTTMGKCPFSIFKAPCSYHLSQIFLNQHQHQQDIQLLLLPASSSKFVFPANCWIFEQVAGLLASCLSL
jgi:hypothetical protein